MNNNWRTAMTISETQPRIKDDKPATSRRRVGKPKKAEGEMAAYYKALARGFAPGHELDDWLAAEKEAD
jgi:hypothetical protein